MPYFTHKIKQSQHETPPISVNYDFTDIYNNTLLELTPTPTHFTYEKSPYFKTFTRLKEEPYLGLNSFCSHYNAHLKPTHSKSYPETLITRIAELAKQAAIVLNQPLSERFVSWYVPKKSGGLRKLSKPLGLTREFQDEFKILLEDMYLLPHNAAHAYVKQRSIKTPLQVHQEFESKFFLKLDIQDFFGSHTYTYIMEQLKQIYPICGFFLHPETNNHLHTIIRACLLDGGLPQGSPVSPLLTNLCMIPIDYAITRKCGKFFRYTRYADDLLITSKTKFNHTQWATAVQTILSELSPFMLKPEKTRFGKTGGRNWNLGLMLDANNKITLGHKRKETIKAMIHNFIRDYDNNRWTREQTQVFQGELSFFIFIEPDYINNILAKYPDIREKIKSILR